MKLSPRHEAFAQAVASKMPAGRAYEAAGYSAKGVNADKLGSRLAKKVDISARIAELTAKVSKKAEIEREGLVERLLDILDSESGTYKGSEVKSSDRVAAAREIAKLCGFNAPEKIEHDVSDPMAELLREIRERK